MVAGLRWSFFVLALITVVLAAYMFRYEPLAVPGTTSALTFVWDRWTHRPCMAGVKYGKPICTYDEMDEFRRKEP